MAIRAQTFPGVYSTVRDQSFVPQTTSRFNVGLLGPAEKGPFDVAVQVRSMKDYERSFGKPLSKSYLSNAVQLIAEQSDGMHIVRVGRQYTEVGSFNNTSGAAAGGSILTDGASHFVEGDWVKIRQKGKKTTIAQVGTVSGTSLGLDTNATGSQNLQDVYAATAVLFRSTVAGAANEAESFLYPRTWGAAIVQTATGTKGAYQFQLSAANGTVVAGAILQISQTNKKTTHEVRVREVRPDNMVILESINVQKVGYQALPLQDTYSGAVIKVATGVSTTPTIQLYAATAGTWANTSGTSGLKVAVAPGTQAGTKKLLIYENSALVETVDNCSTDSTSANYYETLINGKSQYITLSFLGTEHPANTMDGWDTTATKVNVTTFIGGANGEDVTSADYIGNLNVVDDTFTGLKVFTDTDNLDIDFLWTSPTDVGAGTSIEVAQELASVAGKVNAVGLIDVPKTDATYGQVNARGAIDWHNGEGIFSGRGKLDTYRLACFWNWFEVVDKYSKEKKFVPPALGALRCLAFTFDQYKPWYAPAGDKRGLIPEAVALNYPVISQDTKHAMYGNGNCVNAIITNRGRIMLFGDRTMQRAESKHSQLHAVVTTNEIVKGLSEISRQFIFDPNDSSLLLRLNMAATAFMEKLANERGIEEFLLTIDEKNNTAEVRNRNEAIIDVSYIPIGALERVFLNATCNESGANLNEIQ